MNFSRYYRSRGKYNCGFDPNIIDIEYTINISENNEYVINLLQCRPLQVAHNTEDIIIPSDIEKDKIFLECRHASMGLSTALKLDYIVMVDPIAYYNMEYHSKYRIAKAIGAINWHFRNKGVNLLLLTPGRIGTSSPELGVPTTFADISEFNAICEISEKKAGYMPELSYGSHIFQDLVEANILYGAVFDNEKTIAFQPELVKTLDNILTEFCPNDADLRHIIGVYHVSSKESCLYHDIREERLLCTI